MRSSCSSRNLLPLSMTGSDSPDTAALRHDPFIPCQAPPSPSLFLTINIPPTTIPPLIPLNLFLPICNRYRSHVYQHPAASSSTIALHSATAAPVTDYAASSLPRQSRCLLMLCAEPVRRPASHNYHHHTLHADFARHDRFLRSRLCVRLRHPRHRDPDDVCGR